MIEHQHHHHDRGAAQQDPRGWEAPLEPEPDHAGV